MEMPPSAFPKGSCLIQTIIGEFHELPVKLLSQGKKGFKGQGKGRGDKRIGEAEGFLGKPLKRMFLLQKKWFF
jgi:hypothetical protein